MEINLNQLTEDLKKLEIVKRLTESEKEKFGDISQEEISKYLNELRKSGVTNMFGATPYIEKEFGISKEDARKALSYWMKNFKKNESKRPKKKVCPNCGGYGDSPEGRDPCDTCKGKGTVNESQTTLSLVDELDEIEGRLQGNKKFEKDVLEAFELAGVNNFEDLVREDIDAAEALVICYAGKRYESKVKEHCGHCAEDMKKKAKKVVKSVKKIK